MKSYPKVLAIAGSDPSGGAGIQADIKTISAMGLYAMTAVTAITAQNTCGVRAVEAVSPQMVEQQIRVVLDDITPDAVKIGMTFSAATVSAIVRALAGYDGPVVLDPVITATSGDALAKDEAVEALKTLLVPRATLVTPNVAEAELLCHTHDLQRQIHEFAAMGAGAVLLKGGDRSGSLKTDILWHDGVVTRYEAPEVSTPNTHGTGCTLSSAIACGLALGLDIERAVNRAKDYITRALQSGADVITGHGHGPVCHFFDPQPLMIL